MKIAILSDIHDNLANLEKSLVWCNDKGAESMICCGDVTDGQTLEYLAKTFSGKIYLVRSNVELFDENEVKQYENIAYFKNFGVVDLAPGQRIGICHEPALIGKVVIAMRSERKKNSKETIFYGHTHQPWEGCEQGIRTINPGTVAGVFSQPTFALWDSETGDADLLRLNSL